MKNKTPEQIAKAWVVLQRNFWANDLVVDICQKHPIKGLALPFIKKLKNKSPEQIAKAEAVSQRNWWAYEQALTICEQHPQKAWSFLKHLVELADTKELILDIGAGPLEDFIRVHASTYIKRIESLAAENARFRKALHNVWIKEKNEDVYNRLVKLGCIPLEPMDKKKSPTSGSRVPATRCRVP